MTDDGWSSDRSPSRSCDGDLSLSLSAVTCSFYFSFIYLYIIFDNLSLGVDHSAGWS